jgi:hypothetical protein
MRRKTVRWALMALTVAVAGLARGQAAEDDKALKEDLRNLQGKWEHTFTAEEVKGVLNFPVGMRKLHEVRGNSERVTRYAPDGTAFRVNVVDFRLERRGEERVLFWFNGKVTEGDGAGELFQDGSFVYRLEGDRWTETLPDGETIVWKRVKDKK